MSIAPHTVGHSTVRVWKEGTGTPLLYLHGYEQHPGEAPFLKRLSANRQVIAPEHPGYGESTGFDDIDGVLDMTLHLRRLVESLGTGPVDVVGHNLGGMFAAEFAAICPQLTRKLVLSGPFGVWLDEHPAKDFFVLNDTDLKAAKWANAEHASLETSLPSSLHEGSHAAVLNRTQNLSVATKYLWPIPDRGLRKRLPLITAPTLILQGEADGLVTPPYAREFVRLIPGAQLQTLPGAGHLPMFEAEDAFVSAVEAFLG
ncbi:alpha/beta hydrolase [bacterium SCGC AG-212-C10]|nr:alpha/beta hydrolase [bacterium SCGC AG-212-C10]